MPTSAALTNLANTLKLVRRERPMVEPGNPFLVDIVPRAENLWLPDALLTDMGSNVLTKDVRFEDALHEPDTDPSDLNDRILGGMPILGGVGPNFAGTPGTIAQHVSSMAVETRLPIQLDVTWRVLHNGRELDEDEWLALNGVNALQGGFLLPIETTSMTLRSLDPTPSEFEIQAAVTLSFQPPGGGMTVTSDTVTLALPVVVPKVPIPVVFAFFRRAHFEGGALVAVPADSAVRDVVALKRELGLLRVALRPVRALRRFAKLLLGIEMLDSALSGVRKFAFVPRNEVPDLSDVILKKKHLMSGTMFALDTENIPLPNWGSSIPDDLSITDDDNDLDASNIASSMMILAPEGWSVECYENVRFNPDGGWLTFGSGALLASFAQDLDTPKPRSFPKNTIEVMVERSTFHNCISSIRFRRPRPPFDTELPVWPVPAAAGGGKNKANGGNRTRAATARKGRPG